MIDGADMHPIALTRTQVREVDRIAIRELGIPGLVLMENAGRAAADLILSKSSDDARVAIVCGGGNNGGDGFVIARLLAEANRRVTIFMACDPARLSGDAATNYHIASRMALDFVPFDSPERIQAAQNRLQQSDVIVDALLGTGFTGRVRPPIDSAIHAINAAANAKIVAVDLPSGLDCNTGLPSSPTVRAHDTITFIAIKQGLNQDVSREFAGQVHVADIGTPPELTHRVRQQIS